MPVPPPKQKVKKLTKKELKELALEEAKKKEEEEKIRLEEEEKKRQELERLRKIEEERLAAEERARLTEEELDSEVQRQVFKENLENSKKVLKASFELKRISQSSSNPDSSRESELTTFITIYKESKPVSNLSIKEELEYIQYSENIVQEIYQQIAHTRAETRQSSHVKLEQKGVVDDTIQKNTEYIKQIRNVSLKKLDTIAAILVMNTDSLMEEKQLEVQKKISEGPSKGYKQDDKHKQEIFKIYQPLADLKFGLWINPNSKSGYRHKPNDFQELEVQCEVPRTLMSTMLIMKVVWTGFDYLSNDAIYSKDMTVGGVLDIECLEFLPLSKKVNNWTLKMNYDINEALKRYSYPAVDSSGQVNYQNVNPVKIYYTLPSHVYVHPSDREKIRIGVFDKTTCQWQTDCVEEVKYDLDKKIITFNTLRLAPFAFLQERSVDFPYQKWKLRCVGNEKAILDIVGKRDTFRFMIHPGSIALIDKLDPEFKHLLGKKMQVGQLFYEIQRCGVNLMPVKQDAYVTNIVEKDQEAEELAIRDISEAVRAFYIESSRWNNSDLGETVAVKIKENLEFDEDFAENQEKDWKTIRWWFNKCSAIQARDSQSKCNMNPLPGTVTHCNLEVLLKAHGLTQPEALQKIKDLHYVIFTDTVAQVLRLTKLLTFTIKD